MCPTNGMEGKGPGEAGGRGQILEVTKTLLSIKWVGLNESVISQSGGRGLKWRRGSCGSDPMVGTQNPGLVSRIKIKGLEERRGLYSPIFNTSISQVFPEHLS